MPRRCWPEQPNTEYAALPRHVLDADVTSARLHAASRERETQPEAAFVAVPLRPRREQFIRVRDGQPAALVLHLECHSVFRCLGAEPHVPLGATELECVTQEVRQSRSDERAISIDLEPRFHLGHGELLAARISSHRRLGFDFLNELADVDALPMLDACLNAHVGEGARDQVLKPMQAALEDGPSASTQADLPVLQYPER